MNVLFTIGKYLFILPFAFFGLGHFMSAKEMATQMNVPGGEIMVYVTGALLILAAISMIIGKLDKLAAVLLAVFLLLTAFLIHLPAMSMDIGECSQLLNQMSMSNLIKDVMIAGAALVYAKSMAKDPAVIGA